MQKNVGLTLCSLLFLSAVSCTMVTVKPDIVPPKDAGAFVLKGRLMFDGNSAFIPRTIVDSKESSLSLIYEYKVFYDGTKLQNEIIAGLMPTTLLGLPTGGDDVLAVVKLDIRRNDTPVKAYSAEALVTRRRSIFGGGVDKTEMRRVALIAAKESIENQMIQEGSLLQKLMNGEGL